MKTFCISVIMLLILPNLTLGQSKASFGLEGGLAIPTGVTSDKYGLGFGAGGFAIIPTSSEIVSVVLGANYLNMSGKTTTETETYTYGYSTTTTTYLDLQVGTIYAGPKFGQATGPYFLPSVSLNFSKETRLGFYLGGGILFPSESIKFHLGARYGILNLLGKTEKEDSEGGIAILAGVVF